MRIRKSLIGLATFTVSLWVIVIVTYAKQTTLDGAKLGRLIPLQQSSCSSSSSSSSSGE